APLPIPRRPACRPPSRPKTAGPWRGSCRPALAARAVAGGGRSPPPAARRAWWGGRTTPPPSARRRRELRCPPCGTPSGRPRAAAPSPALPAQHHVIASGSGSDDQHQQARLVPLRGHPHVLRPAVIDQREIEAERVLAV